MKKQLLIFTFVFLLLITLVSGTDFTTNNIMWHQYYNATNTSTALSDYSTNGNDGELFGVITPILYTPAPLLGFGYPSQTSSINVSDDPSQDSNSKTISMWVTPTDTSVTQYFYSETGAALYYGGGQVRMQFSDGTFISGVTSYGMSNNNLYHVIFVWESGFGARFYVNGTYVANDTSRTGNLIANTATIKIGNNAGSTSRYQGNISNIGTYSYAFTGAQALELYNQGLGYNPYVGTSPVLDITLQNYYDNSSLSNFTAYIGAYVFDDNGTGTITTNITSSDLSPYNITIAKDNYFNSTYLNYNVSSDLSAFINNTNITMRIVFTGTNITANVSNTLLQDLNNSVNFTSSNGIYNINPYSSENITFTVSCNRSVFETRNETFSFTARDEGTYIFYVNETKNYVYFNNAKTGNPIVGANITVTYPESLSELTTSTDSTGKINFSWIYNNASEFGNYTLLFDNLGYNRTTIILPINSSGVPYNETYNISVAKLNITIYDRETGDLLNNTNVTINLIGVFSDVTSTGNYTYDNLTLVSGEYSIIALSTGYSNEQISFDFTNQEVLDISIYMLNLTSPNAGTIFIEVLNEQTYTKEIDVLVSMQELDYSTGAFFQVAQCYTNSNGECVFNIELNSKTYKFLGTKTIDSQIYSDQTSSNGEIISIDEDVRQLILRTTGVFNYSAEDNLIYSVSESFVNNISSVSVDFQTSDGTDITICVEYFKTTYLGSSNVTSPECLTSASGTATPSKSYLLNRDNSYYVEIYISDSGNKKVLTTYYYPSINSIESILEGFGIVKYFLLIIFISLLSLSLYLKKLTPLFIGVIFLSWVIFYYFVSFRYGGLATVNTILSLLGIKFLDQKEDQV